MVEKGWREEVKEREEEMAVKEEEVEVGLREESEGEEGE